MKTKRLPFKAFKELQGIVQADLKENISIYGYDVPELRKYAGDLILADFVDFCNAYDADYSTIYDYIFRSIKGVVIEENNNWDSSISNIPEYLTYSYIEKFYNEKLVPRCCFSEWENAVREFLEDEDYYHLRTITFRVEPEYIDSFLLDHEIKEKLRRVYQINLTD